MQKLVLRFLTYEVASNYSWNQFISENHTKILSIKLHSLQKSVLEQLYTPARDCKVNRNIPRSHFLKTLFSLSVAFLMTSVASQKRRPFNVVFNWRHVMRV